jgi:hypothetical protein
MQTHSLARITMSLGNTLLWQYRASLVTCAGETRLGQVLEAM